MITSELLAQIFPNTSQAKRDRFIGALNKFCARYGIDSYLRICAFLATGGVETDYLRVTTEYASGTDYEGRKDLGNTQTGDGVRFRGRGFFQTTGRYNYGRVNKVLGALLNINFLTNPQRLAEIDVAVESACVFWKENNLAKYADRGEFKELSAVVNCGNPNAKPNHWEKRNELYSLCKRRIPADFSFAPKPVPIVAPQLSDQNTQPVVLTPTDDSGFDLPDLNLDTAKQRLTDGVELAKRPGVKAVLKVIGTKIFIYLTTVWELGLSGKVALILGAVLAVSSIGYVIFHYRNQIKSAFIKLKAAVVKAVKKKTTNET